MPLYTYPYNTKVIPILLKIYCTKLPSFQSRDEIVQSPQHTLLDHYGVLLKSWVIDLDGTRMMK